MNLDALRAELNAMANDIDASAQGRMAGIRAKAAADRRRRRTGATAAAAVVAIGAIVGVPVVTDRSGEPGPTDGGAPFPAAVNGDTRIAYQVGDKGQTRVSLTFTPDNTGFQLSVSCRWSATASRSVRLSVNTTPLSVRCPSNADSNAVVGPIAVGADASVDEVHDYWLRRSVESGSPVRVTLDAHIERGDPLREALRTAKNRAESARVSREHADAELANATTRAERRQAKQMVLEATRVDHRRRKELDAARKALDDAESSVLLGVAVYDVTG